MVGAIIADRGGAPVAQFRVEFVMDPATGRYFAELYSPENQTELVARTEALYATQAAAVLGLVQLFKDAVLSFPAPRKAKAKKKAVKRRKKPTRRKRK
jgi:hypothetical protein